MTQNTLDAYLEHELSAAPCKSALLMTDLMTGRVLLARNQEVAVPSASTIKLPVLLAMLEGVRQREFTLDQPIPITHVTEDTRIFDRGEAVYSLRELLYWMITVSDNTATNTILDLLGFDRVNAYARDILGLQSTLCRRKMLDFSAARAGLDNTTSAADQCRCYTLLHHGGILDETTREVAMTMLKAQRSTN
ncbi:MAG: serine hydrolase, partial [Pseudoflavonifractor sp.]